MISPSKCRVSGEVLVNNSNIVRITSNIIANDSLQSSRVYVNSIGALDILGIQTGSLKFRIKIKFDVIGFEIEHSVKVLGQPGTSLQGYLDSKTIQSQNLILFKNKQHFL